MDQFRQFLRYHHNSCQTEQTFCDRYLSFIRLHGIQKHPGHGISPGDSD